MRVERSTISLTSGYPGNRPRLSAINTSHTHTAKLENGSHSPPGSSTSSESTSSLKLATTALVDLVNGSRNSQPLWQRDQEDNSSDSSDEDKEDSLDPPSPAYSPAADVIPIIRLPLPKKKAINSNRKKAEGYTARPANAFILYRSEQIRLLKVSGVPKKPQSEVSKLIGQMWRDESKINKDVWMEQAAQEKARHIEKFPDYRFSPVRRNSDSKVKTTRGPYATKLPKIRRAPTNSASTVSKPSSFSTSSSSSSHSPPGLTIPFRRASTSFAPRLATAAEYAPPFVASRTFVKSSTPFFRVVDIVTARPRPVPIIPVAYQVNNSQYLPSPSMDHPSPPHSATIVKQEWPIYHSPTSVSPPPQLPPSPPYTSAPNPRAYSHVESLQQYQNDVQHNGHPHPQQPYIYNPHVRLSSAVLPPPPLYDSYRHHQQHEEQQQQHQQLNLSIDHSSQQAPQQQQQQQYWQLNPNSESYIPPPRQSPQFLHPATYKGPSPTSAPGGYYTYLSQPPDAQHHVLPYSAQDSPAYSSQLSPYPFALSPRPPTSVTSAPGDYFSLPN